MIAATVISLLAVTGTPQDFDFFVGRWQVHNRRLKQRLQGSQDWEEFDAVQENRPLPGRIGNYDDFISDTWRPGYVGMSLRLFNPQTKQWSIYWLDNVSGGLDTKGNLTSPVVGGFRDGVGVFEGDDELRGQPIRVRYTWSQITERSAHWEQAMSGDGGKTWETNWYMDLTRVGNGMGARHP